MTNLNIQENNNNNNNRSERYEDDFDKRKEAYLVSQAFRLPIWRGRNEPSRDSGLRLWKAPWDSSSRDSHKCLSKWCKSSPPLSRTEPPLSMPSPILLIDRNDEIEMKKKIESCLRESLQIERNASDWSQIKSQLPTHFRPIGPLEISPNS